jgi:peptidoglycan/xylan/chitin deacetylase (PgdA/CDA1 family)
LTTFVFLSHDVDWGRKGASLDHILARKDRFDEETLRNLSRKNPYQNIAEVLDVEDKCGIRSTFFFRTYVSDSSCPPASYDVGEYTADIRSMISGGWEIGLHSDPNSSTDLARLEKEKKELERVAGIRVLGNRVHGTLDDARLYPNLKRLNFVYDSSVKHRREAIVEEDFGYVRRDGLIVFPITFMDALVFAHLAKTEADVLKVVKRTLRIAEELGKGAALVTLLWHDCDLKMRFGRKYREVLEYLISLRSVSVKRGTDLVKMIKAGEL